MEMGDEQVIHHLQPLTRLPEVSRIHVVRSRSPAVDRLPRVRYWTTSHGSDAVRLFKTLTACWRIARKDSVGAVISFYPFPYGLIALAMGRSSRKPVHVGFVGSDWHRDAARWPWKWFLPILRRADRLTVPGEAMRTGLIRRGFPAARVQVLFHGVDLDHFQPAAEADPTAIVYVGGLKPVKGVDSILRSYARVVGTGAPVTLQIVGGGPDETRLRVLAHELGVASRIHFAGHVQDVRPFLRTAGTFVLGSKAEGLPYALVEAMACGLVPVVPDVGAIGELIDSGRNGFLYPAGDELALARYLGEVTSRPDLHGSLRQEILAQRDRLGHSRAIECWARWLRQLETQSTEPGVS